MSFECLIKLALKVYKNKFISFLLKLIFLILF